VNPPTRPPASKFALRRWWAQRLSSRIVLLFLGLLLVVQLAGLLVVNASIARNARAQLAEDLKVGENIWQRLLAQRATRLTVGASVLAADFGFREALLSGDLDTLQSALANSGQRIGATVTAMLASDLTLRALGEGSDPEAFESLRPLAPQLASQGSVIALLGGQPYQVVMVPMRAPVLVGYVVMGFPIKQEQLDDMQSVSGLHVALLVQAPDGRRRALMSTVGAQATAELVADTLQDNEAQLDGNAHLLRRITQAEGPAGALQTIVLRSLADAISPYRPLQTTLLALTLLGLVLAGVASVITARRVTTPLRGLTAASERLGRGEYGEALEHQDREDEIGQLARSFDQMRQNIAANEAEIRELAYNDRLTRLPNRASFGTALRDAIANAQAHREPFAVVVLGLDRFKHINENLGYALGDDVLREVAQRLRRHVQREGDVVARLAGDQFALLLQGADLTRATAVVDGISASFVHPIAVRGESVDAPLTFGVACWPQHAPEAASRAGADGMAPAAQGREQAEVLMSRAERAMAAAKRGKATHMVVYDPAIDVGSEQSLTLLSELRQAIGANELRLYLQPKIDIASHTIVGAEALVRWQHPTRGMVPPMKFIPFAEDTGFVRQLTLWIFEEAARQWPALKAAGLHRISVNLSTRDLLDPELPTRFDAILRRQGVPATAFCLEITESAVMNEPKRALAMLNTLAAAGFELSIDDYGEGQTSLSYLKTLPVHELKIDQIFIKQIDRDAKDATIVRSTIGLAHSLGFRAVAEGVENEAIMALLRELGCDEAQGFHLGRPMPAAEMPGFARQWAGQPVAEAAEKADTTARPALV
jgi:diguanylate cyclase (GGDEF)-like protein